MNEPILRLQGKDQSMHDMYTNVRPFKSNLTSSSGKFQTCHSLLQS